MQVKTVAATLTGIVIGLVWAVHKMASVLEQVDVAIVSVSIDDEDEDGESDDAPIYYYGR